MRSPATHCAAGVTSKVSHLTGPLADGLASQVHTLAAAVTETDGIEPFGEAILLGLQAEGAEHLLAYAPGGTLAGYASLSPDTIELAVAPAYRRTGMGTALAEAAFAAQPHACAWAHGNLPAARGLATKLGLTPTRELLFMTGPVPVAPPVPASRPDVVIRTFESSDANAWVDLNAIVFADHPEQGQITRPDLDARRSQEWFDPTAFWVAIADGELVGYVWTKIIDDDGEIYVIGVAPSQQGSGLGGALLDTALRSFAQRGLATMSLYVDADNPAERLYRRFGFDIAERHMQYRFASQTSPREG